MGSLTMSTTAHHGGQQSCADAGRCQGRKIPCLTCTRPDAAPWPPEQDTFTPAERMGWPLCVAACVGLVTGFLYGLVRHFNPAWFN